MLTLKSIKEKLQAHLVARLYLVYYWLRPLRIELIWSRGEWIAEGDGPDSVFRFTCSGYRTPAGWRLKDAWPEHSLPDMSEQQWDNLCETLERALARKLWEEKGILPFSDSRVHLWARGELSDEKSETRLGLEALEREQQWLKARGKRKAR